MIYRKFFICIRATLGYYKSKRITETFSKSQYVLYIKRRIILRRLFSPRMGMSLGILSEKDIVLLIISVLIRRCHLYFHKINHISSINFFGFPNIVRYSFRTFVLVWLILTSFSSIYSSMTQKLYYKTCHAPPFDL